MKKVEYWLFFLFLIMVIIANGSNAINQVVTIFRIQAIVNEQKVNIDKLTIEENFLVSKVEYAQTDEYKQRATRELLGLGTQDDYWIGMPEMPKSQNFSSVYPKVETVSAIPHWKQWLNLIVDE